MNYNIIISKNSLFSVTADIANGVSPSFQPKEGKLLDNYNISIEHLSIDKQIYSPNCVRLQLLVETKNGKGIISARKELRAFLIDSKLSVNLISSDNKNVLDVVKAYPVTELKYMSNMSKISLELLAYSPDQYATLDKHSEAFTGKTIKEILEKAIKNRFGCDYNTSRTLHFHYMFAPKAEEKEIRQYHRIPYAVQYNESTYDFIARLAKKHGEFLFYENSCLYLGYQHDQADEQEKVIKISGADIANMSFEDCTPRAQTLYVGTNHLATEDEDNKKRREKDDEENRRSGVELTDEQKKQNENTEKEEDKRNKGKEVQYKVFNLAEDQNTPLAIRRGYNIVNQENANNDAFVDIRNDLTVDERTDKEQEDAFLKDPGNFNLEDESLLALYDTPFYIGGVLTAIGDILGSPSYLDMPLAAAMNVKTLTYDAYQEACAINLSYKDNIGKDEMLQNVTRYNDGPYGQSQLKYLDNFAFLSFITERSLDAKDNKITLELTNTFFDKNLKLGCLISLEEESVDNKGYIYVVTAMHVKQTQQQNLPSKMLLSIIIEAIPYRSSKDGGTVPYFDQNDLKRESSTQVAIVVDTKDPYRLNRVRVCYPWQFVNDCSAITDSEKVEKPDFIKNYKDLDKNVLRESASPWIRVSTPAAKGGGGFIFTPELYSEVLVNYENGNIERPYVENSVYRMGDGLFDLAANNEHTSTISSHHGQKIIFHDGNDGLSFFSNIVGPIFDLGLGFIPSDGIKGLEDIAPFDGYTEITDKYSINSLKLSATDRNVTIKSSLGDININALTGISIESPNGDVSIKGKNVTISAGNQLSITSGKNIGRPSKASSTKISVVSLINGAVGLNFELIRTIFEAIFKPVGGAMVIKSNRYLCLEAGRGNAQVSAYVKQNPLNPRDVSEAEVVPIKEPLLHFIRIFDNCRVATELIKEKEIAYRDLYESPVVGYEKNLSALEVYLVSNKMTQIKEVYKKILKPQEVKTGEQLERVKVDLDIKDADLKQPEVVEMVDAIKENTERLVESLNAFKETKHRNRNKLLDEIEQISLPLKDIITKRLFKDGIPLLEDLYSDNYTDYQVVKQAIQGELAAKRILLLALLQLMQEDGPRNLFNVSSSILVMDLPEPIQDVLDKIVKADRRIGSKIGDKLTKRVAQIVCAVHLKKAKALTEENISEINASWRFIVKNLYVDEEMSWKDVILEAIGMDGLRDDMPYFVDKGTKLDRRTLSDGNILFSDDRHQTYRYDSNMKEFVTTDTSYDNEIAGKLREVLGSLQEEII